MDNICIHALDTALYIVIPKEYRNRCEFAKWPENFENKIIIHDVYLHIVDSQSIIYFSYPMHETIY